MVINDQRSQSATESLEYRSVGRSGLKLPPISLGLWQNFGEDRPRTVMSQVILRALELGITHFDLANNYGPPPGAAERHFGEILRTDLRGMRNQLVISTKAGYDMWPGPYGMGGSRKYLLSSLRESLQRMGLEWVDIFYSHRYDPTTPLEETMGALTSAVHLGLSLYVGISSYSEQTTRQAAEILSQNGTPLLVHQPSYSMLNRWIERGLLDALSDIGAGCIAFSPLAQGLLTSRYLGVDPDDLDGTLPEGSRARLRISFDRGFLRRDTLVHLHALNDIAEARGQTLAQLALAWCLRRAQVSSVLVGASSVRQLEENVTALRNLDFSHDELDEIDQHAVEAGVNLWQRSSAAGGEVHEAEMPNWRGMPRLHLPGE